MIKNPKIEFIKSSRNKEQIILDNKYIYNFASEDKKGNKNYKCNYYKTVNKCSSSIKLNKEKNIVKYEDYHNHEVNIIKASAAKAKSEIKNIITKEENPFALKGKSIYKDATKNLGLIVPEYNTLKATINRHINKNFPKEITSWEEIPDESDYYETISNENFMIRKTDNYIIFQSKTQAVIQHQNDNSLFCDATFYAAPSIAYQLLITRVYAKDFNRYFTTSFSIMKNKQENTYENVFKDLKILRVILIKDYIIQRNYIVILNCPYLMHLKEFFLELK